MGDYVFTSVQADHTIEIQAEPDVTPPVFFTIVATAGAGCTITPGGTVQVAQGTDQAFHYEADPGFHITKVIVDGVEVTL